MNNLLRTLTESQVKSTADLKLLLTTVKEARRQSYDAKISDPFYESLEGLLHDLRTVTMDNHDADAFLKPVPRAEYPDYYDIIQNPMDLQTMLKKVKAKQYKSKREFRDDLDLIWSNCHIYNSTEDHPLRLCANRLKMKAEKLLANITDRKERVDPPIPFGIASKDTPPPKLNGITNGHAKKRTSSRPPTHAAHGKQPARASVSKSPREVPFADSSAIIRTAEGMVAFHQLDQDLDGTLAGPSRAPLPFTSASNGIRLSERLRNYVATTEPESEVDDDLIDSSNTECDTAGKRKSSLPPMERPRKRLRLTPPTYENGDILDMWWKAVQSDSLFGNGLPTLVYSSSEGPSISHNQTSPSRQLPRKRKRPKNGGGSSNSLLTLMNNNIKTLKRVRRTHTKFSALNLNLEEGGSLEEPTAPPEEDIEEAVDETPWRIEASGIDIGEQNATDCVRWMNSKVLEHSGFQGTSSVALDVLSGVTSEFLFNVGRTLRFLCDKYSNSMTAEEIILHTLFESGTTKIQNLERYIKDDVVRHGTRLGELEKKLVSAYREATAVDALDDDALFGNDNEEEEEGAFVMGNFTDQFGEDFLGLRELGIAAEFGLSSLSVPKKLLKGKNKAGSKLSLSAAKQTEPPPPYPPPPAFASISSKNADEQIGLLRPYYQSRISALSFSLPQIPGAPPGFTHPFTPNSAFLRPPDAQQPPVTLPDDVPNPVQSKLGPLGQVLKSAVSSNTVKKKGKVKDGAMATKPEDMAMMDLPVYDGGSVTDSPKKKTTPGTGTKRKKVVEFPSVIAASA